MQENKEKRRLAGTAVCTICGTEKDDIGHALCRCPHAVHLWGAMLDLEWLATPVVGSDTGTTWIFNQIEATPKEERIMLFMMLWRIWFVRNELTHEKRLRQLRFQKGFWKAM